jgi:hypothetical protein
MELHAGPRLIQFSRHEFVVARAPAHDIPSTIRGARIFHFARLHLFRKTCGGGRPAVQPGIWLATLSMSSASNLSHNMQPVAAALTRAQILYEPAAIPELFQPLF